jgi:hypothetical protein
MPNDPKWVVTEPVQMLHMELDRFGIPIDSVGILIPGEEIHPEWHIVTRDDGILVRVGYLDEAIPAQTARGDHIIMTLDLSPRQVRSVWDIYEDIAALSESQLAAIYDDLQADNKAKIKSVGPPADAAVLALDWATGAVTISPLESPMIGDAYTRIAAIYTQHNVNYLDRPAFDPTISISGWEFIP